uniref:Si:ch211-202p1.5 n=1 Tax=Paramormyrops kingsleyae TaxID=1676925 RepID=A0A3B3RC22_9TELE
MDLTGLYLLTTTLVFILQREDRSQKTHAPSGPPHRVKRCSCENLKDMECVYFCHIGIVWVNTPGQVVPFGEGLYPVRLRRDTGRCVCAGGGDTECLRFCATRRLQRELGGLFKKLKNRYTGSILHFYRSRGPELTEIKPH